MRHTTHDERQMAFNSTSGYKGVSYHKRDKRWQAQFCYHGDTIHLGNYKTKEEAYNVYCQVAERYNKERPGAIS
jgi:hypothetical protein